MRMGIIFKERVYIINYLLLDVVFFEEVEYLGLEIKEGE